MTPEERLIWLQFCPAGEVTSYLGDRARETRRARNQTQAEFALEAGVAFRTYKRFEASGAATLETFVKVMQLVSCAKYLAFAFPVAPARAIQISRSRALGLDP